MNNYSRLKISPCERRFFNDYPTMTSYIKKEKISHFGFTSFKIWRLVYEIRIYLKNNNFQLHLRENVNIVFYTRVQNLGSNLIGFSGFIRARQNCINTDTHNKIDSVHRTISKKKKNPLLFLIGG